MAEEGRVYGIDLGTTYSCISYLDDTGRAVVCQSQEGGNTIPSVVRLMPGEEAVVGETAKDTSVIYSENTIQFVKSRIGREESFEYGSEDDRQTTTPEDVSAEILKKCANDASMITNSEVRAVVITVPAYFGVREREVTKNAGIKAGLTVVDIVEEPTAAAFYYGAHSNEDTTICVFDLGGGTFDVTAMDVKSNGLYPITTDGNHDLGGKNWDEEIKNMLKEKFIEATGFEDEFDEDFEQELQITAEKMKRQLSGATSAQASLKMDRNHKASIEITRDEFEARTSYLMDTAIDLTRQVFDRVKEKEKNIDKILLVGGSTFMPQVKDALDKEFGIPIEINEPNEAVSKGACIYCAWKLLHPEYGNTTTDTEGEDNGIEYEPSQPEDSEGTVTVKIGGKDGEEGQVIKLQKLPGALQDMEVKTIATKSFGIEVLVGDDDEVQISNMVIKDALLPFTCTKTFGLHRANMGSIEVKLYQSERYEELYDPDDGLMIGNATLEDIPANTPANTPVDLEITIEVNGLVKVTGKMTESGQPLSGELNIQYEEGVGSN